MKKPTVFKASEGTRFPLGSQAYEDGVNFSIFSRSAISAELHLFEDAASPHPFQVIKLDPELHRTHVFWHVFVEQLPPGICYTWRMDGPTDTEHSGGRFNPQQDLLDPWAKAVTDLGWNRKAALAGKNQAGLRAMVVETPQQQHTTAPRQPRYRSQEIIVYEVHVGGFTRHPSSQVAKELRGTFAGVIEKIPYLKSLGITHVELLPVMAFDPQHAPDSVLERGLENYWGYSTHSFYSPHPHYCATPEKGTHLAEFKAMVDALHDAGLEIILDVVLNHTAEGGVDDPIINFKGIANDVFYHLDPNDRSIYRDYTGCGNTVNCNHPIVSAYFVHCLEFWVDQMGVDGFRFDLASAMARGENGEPMASPPILWSIELSPSLMSKWLIAEAWDAAGLYQVGNFPGYRWAEWNGRYRDVMRRFIRGDGGILTEVATRLCGSSDYYQREGHHPFNSINFISCHDGFTLWDQVSYNNKHNLPNGENDRDGHNDNLSWNCGVEGETDDKAIIHLRKQQARNFMAILLLSQGVPMILAGDEVHRTQNGNNNAWCQDNETSWFDWSLTQKNADMLRFTREMIQLRKRHPSLQRRQFLKGEPEAGNNLPDIEWQGIENEPPWDDPTAHFLRFTLAGRSEDEPHLHVIMNMGTETQTVRVPNLEQGLWHLAVDTSQPPPKDIYPPGEQPAVGDTYKVMSRSVVVLELWRN